MTMPMEFDREYRSLVWDRWRYRAGDFGSLRRADPPIPPRYGVYLIRAPDLLPRVRGSSDVVYVGQSGGGALPDSRPENGAPNKRLRRTSAEAC